MSKINLSKKPLVEAIFELRWELPEIEEGVKKDIYYPILIGALYEKVKDEYPFHEELPTSKIPHDMAEYIVQHRFRRMKDGWPLIQLGPGIISINDTDSYTWESFRERIFKIIDELYRSYPDPSKLNLDGLLLRYIDAVKFDFSKDNVFNFLREKMKIDVKIYEKLFNGGVNQIPIGIDLRFAFVSNNPQALVNMRFTRAKKDDEDALTWETIVRAEKKKIPATIEGIKNWIDQAHGLADDWFFKIIEGELLERFK